jgi:mono/diheme cytochrome c family protein
MKRPLRIVLVVIASLVVLLAAAFGLAVLSAGRAFTARHDVPAPAVTAATSPEALARGKHLFQMVCAGCHLDEHDRAAGRFMADVPEFLGKFYTANITSDREHGIGTYTEGELARLLRTGVRRDGRLAGIMPTFSGLSDADLAAVMGFVLRSGDPVFAPVAATQPRIQPSLVGKLILRFVVGVDPAPLRGPVTAPPAAPTADYGRYLVLEVLQCGDCHSPGFAGDKARREGAFTGGFEMADARGRKIYTPNLTPDAATGIGGYGEADFVRAVRDGIRPDGHPLSPPMIRYRMLDDVELAAMYAFFRTLPPVHNPIERPVPEPAPAGTGADARFVALGCVACHAEGAAFREKLRAAADRPVEEVARRILHPEAFNPNTQMPTFAGRVDEAEAHRLAEYAQGEARKLPPAGTGTTSTR